MTTDPRPLVREAKHSYAVLLGFIADPDTKCNRMLLKWPDVIDALLADNQQQFEEDIACLICLPVKLVAEALSDNLFKVRPQIPKYEQFINDVMRLAVQEPVGTKDRLIKVCNEIIGHLRVAGVGHEYVKNMRGELP